MVSLIIRRQPGGSRGRSSGFLDSGFRRKGARWGCLIFLWCLAGSISSFGADGDTQRRGATDPESLFLDLSKVNLGTITTEDDKKKYLYTIQLEKARITRKTLRAVYDNAYDLYKAGDYEGTKELTTRILTIDPGYEDAAILQRAAIALRGSSKPGFSEHKLVESKFDEGMSLYRRQRYVEASEKWDEVLKLAPNNLKARYWAKKVRGELADEHFRRGQELYRQHKLKETLDQWYSALALNPRYPRLVPEVAKVEAELRQSEANDKLQGALQLYSQGKNDEALKTLDEVLQVEPGDPKAQRLMSEIRTEMANQYVAQGRRMYSQRQYNGAIAQWKKAIDYGYDAGSAETLIARAREQMRAEADAKRRQDEEARRREEEEKRKAEEEAKKKAEEEQKAQEAAAQKGGGGPVAPPTASSDENRREAVRHWQTGIIAFQGGQYDKARDEWILCKQLDPTNEDCVTGLKRIDQQLGGP